MTSKGRVINTRGSHAVVLCRAAVMAGFVTLSYHAHLWADEFRTDDEAITLFYDMSQ